MSEIRVNSTNTDRLSKILGYDPANQHGGSGVLSTALKEIQDEQDKATLAQTKELVYKAMEVRKKMSEKLKQVNSEVAKFDKELGKLLNKIESFSKGKTLSEIENDENSKEEPKE